MNNRLTNNAAGYVLNFKKEAVNALLACMTFLMLFNTVKAQTTEPYNWSNAAIGGGGFVSSIIPSRTGGGPIYARTDVGGAYRWDVANSKWIPLTDFASETQQGVFGTLSMAIDPQHINVVYALAGISYFNGGNSYILRSTDYGAHWAVTNVTAQFKVNGNGMGRQNGERLQVDPFDSVLYCGTQANGLFKSADQGATWTATSLAVTTTPNANGISFVVIDKYNGTYNGHAKTVFAGVSRMGSNLNFYRSDNAGTSFAAVDNPNLPDSLMPQRAVLTSGGAYLYITYGNGAGPSYTAAEPYNKGAIWRYTVATGAWLNVTPASMSRAFCGISADPTNSQRLIASTCNTYYTQGSSGASGDRFFLTTDGGTNWTDLVARGFSIDNNGVPWLSNASIHWAGCIEFDPANVNRVFVTSGNGTFLNDDITNTAGVWKVNVKGIEEVVPRNMVSMVGGPIVSVISDYDGFTQADPTQYATQRHTPTMGSTVALDYAVTNKKVVRAASSMYYSTDMGYTWTKTNVFNGSDGQVAVSADGNTFLHCPTGSSTIYKTVSNGNTWSISNPGPGVTNARPVADGATSSKFYVYDSQNGRMYLSTDWGTTFNPTAGAIAAGGSKIIRSVPTFDGNVWIALNNGGLVYTQNSGTSFTTVGNVTYCASVGIGKKAQCSAYPTIFIWGSISGSANGLYRSFDMGANWARVNDDDHEYGGPGNGQFVIGDMNTVGNVYMSTAGRGIAMGTRIPALSVAPTTLTFASTAGAQTVTVTSVDSWTVSDNQSWISITNTTQCSPSAFTVNVTANTGTTSRVGIVTVVSNGITRTIEINQNYNCTPTTITPYVKVNLNAWIQTPYASLAAGGTVSLGPQPNVTTGYDWTGPNGFTSTARQVDLTNIQVSQAGTYIATYTNAGGCKDSQTFTVDVTGGGSFAAMATAGTATVPAVQQTSSPETSNDGVSTGSTIIAYPNPVDRSVTLKIPHDMIGGKITLHNAMGILMHSGKVTQIDYIIDMGPMPTGLYFINVSNTKGSKGARIIKR